MRTGVVDEINWGQQQRSTTSFHSSVNIWNKRKPFLRSEHIVIQVLGLWPCFSSTLSLSPCLPLLLFLLPTPSFLPLSLSVSSSSSPSSSFLSPLPLSLSFPLSLTASRGLPTPLYFLVSYLKGVICKEDIWKVEKLHFKHYFSQHFLYN